MRGCVLLLLLAGCGGASEAELAERARAGANGADPAITAALEDPIMSDRTLSVADHSLRVRTVTGPAQSAYPRRDGDNRGAFAPLAKLAPGPGCETGFSAGGPWAAKLPARFAVPAGSELVEAAGHDYRGCAARMAVFRTVSSARAIAERYGRLAVEAGYEADLSPRGADQVLAARRAADGATLFLIASPRAGGSEVSLLTGVQR